MSGAAAAGRLLLLLCPPLSAVALITPSFSPPLLVSAPVQCYDGKLDKLCGFNASIAEQVANESCKCPPYPTAAGGTDGFYGMNANASQMMGLYNQQGMQGNWITWTNNGGLDWSVKKFNTPVAAFNWNLYPVDGGKGRRNFGGISQGSFRHSTGSAPTGSMTDRGWTGTKSATFSFDKNGVLQMATTGAVTVGPLPQAVNNTNGPKGGGTAPQFYGGPIELHDGSLLGTIGIYWSKDDPLSPTPDGPYHRMSVVAIKSTDRLTWHYAGVVANASGPGGYPTCESRHSYTCTSRSRAAGRYRYCTSI